jgi:hypothetical protein
MHDIELISSNYNNLDKLKWFEIDFNYVSRLKIQKYIKTNGFCIVRTNSITGSPVEKLRKIAGIFGLDRPYIPVAYRKSSLESGSAYTDVCTLHNHQNRSFMSSESRGFHVDGLLEPMGFVRTSMLYCIRPAVEGGETIILNSVGLFADLMKKNPEAASTFVNSNVLCRKATVPGVKDNSMGPVIEFDRERGILNRYSDGDTEEWYPPQNKKKHFWQALNFFRQKSRFDGRRRISLKLKNNDCLIMCNSKVSHARSGYRDDVIAPRHLIRAIYLEDCV